MPGTNGQGEGGGGGLYNEFVTYCRYALDESGLNRFLAGLQRAVTAATDAVGRIADRLRSSRIGQSAATLGRGIADGVRQGMGGANGSVASFFRRTREGFKGIAKEAGSLFQFGRMSGGYSALDLHGADLNTDRMNKALATRNLQSLNFTPVHTDMAALGRSHPGLNPATYSNAFGRASEMARKTANAGAEIGRRLSGSLNGLTGRVSGLGRAVAGARASAGGLASNMGRASGNAREMGGIIGQMQPMVAQIAALWAGLSFTHLYDTAQSMTDSLGNLLGSAEKAREVQKSILQISKETNSEYEENTEIFSSLHRIQDKTKLGLEDELRLTKAIGQAAAVGGGSIEGRKRAIAQLAKAFGMDQMNAVSLHSIERQAPGITMALAKGLGKSIGDLKKLSSEGKLTGSEVAKALLSQADSINAMSQKVRPSFATIGLQARNIALGIIQDFDHAWHGISTGIQHVLDAMFWLERKGRELFHSLAKRMGGAEMAAKLIAIAVIALGGPLVLSAVARLTSAMWSLAFGTNAAIWPFTLVAAAIAALILIGEDFYVWVQGGNSLIGRMVGPYSEWKGSVDKVKEAVNECWTAIKNLFADSTTAEIDKTAAKNKPWADSFGDVLKMIITVTEKITDLARALKELKEGHTEAAGKIAGNLAKELTGMQEKESWMEGLDRMLFFGGSRENFDLFKKNGGSRAGLIRRNLIQFGDHDDPVSYIMEKTGKSYAELTDQPAMIGQNYKPNPYTTQNQIEPMTVVQRENAAADSTPGIRGVFQMIQDAGQTMRNLDARNAGAVAPATHLMGGQTVGDVHVEVNVDASNSTPESINGIGTKVANGVSDGLEKHFPSLSMPSVERVPYNS